MAKKQNNVDPGIPLEESTQDDPIEESVAPEDAPAADASQAAEYLAGWQRAQADLANYRKRIERDRQTWEASIKADLILNLLPVLDDFDRALENIPKDVDQDDWLNGITLIQRKLRTQLEEIGLREIDAEGQPFDPTLHEAIMQEDSSDHPSGHVIGVLRRGYRLEDRIVRPALVRIST